MFYHCRCYIVLLQQMMFFCSITLMINLPYLKFNFLSIHIYFFYSKFSSYKSDNLYLNS